MTTICVVNKSTRVSNSDVQLMTRACATQVRLHAAPAWGLTPIPVMYLAHESAAPPGAWVIAVLDDPDQANALGWHTEDQGDVIYGRVFAGPVLDNGGNALTAVLSVASVLSHEVLETLVDPHVNLWADAGGTAVALEVCDPVESDSYPVTVSGQKVMLSNFVTPHWFDAAAAKGEQLDWMGHCTKPFTMTKGGYVVVLKEGKASQQFGEEFPDWKKPLKRVDTARGGRRTTEQD